MKNTPSNILAAAAMAFGLNAGQTESMPGLLSMPPMLSIGPTTRGNRRPAGAHKAAVRAASKRRNARRHKARAR